MSLTPARNLGLTVALLALATSCSMSPQKMKQALMEASATGDAATVEKLLKKKPEIAKFVDENDYKATALHKASSRRIAELLIQYGADINAIDGFNQTPLFATKDPGVAQLLITKGADIHQKVGRGFTAIHKAANAAVAAVFIEFGADINSRVDYQLITPLYEAIQDHREDVALLLIEKGANPNTPDRHNSTPLHLASEYGEPAVVDALIKKGAAINALDVHSATPLHLAALKGHGPIMEMLLKAGANPNLKLAPHIELQSPEGGTMHKIKALGNATPLQMTESPQLKEIIRKYGGQ